MNIPSGFKHASLALLLLAAAGCATGDGPSLQGGLDLSESMMLQQEEEEFANVDFGALETPDDVARHMAVNIGDRVFFNYNSTRLGEQDKRLLRRQANFLKQSGVNVTLEGHCDERGTREFNIGLGLRRATIVRDYLIEAGLDPYRIQTISYGKERPVAPCSRERCWKINRRVVVTIDGAAAGS